MTYTPRHAFGLFAATCVLVAGMAAAGEYLRGKLYAIDGDTFVIRATGEHIRVAGVDAPELHPCHCAAECSLAARARALAQTLLDQGPVTISRIEPDRYGRTVAAVDVAGRDLGGRLIAAGLARPYRYPERRRPWC